jgi:hypothetical protein
MMLLGMKGVGVRTDPVAMGPAVIILRDEMLFGLWEGMLQLRGQQID